jgi:ABC-2 type transport system ATP-binding protein
MSVLVLELKNLTRRFGASTAVDSLTLSVNTGEVFGLLGSNGAGKTTTNRKTHLGHRCQNHENK